MKPESPSDEELLSNLRAGDQDSFNHIYTRYWRTLLAIAYNRLRNQQQSEDVVHDVFGSLWSNRHKTEINNLPAYLATAVKFRILENIRKESVKQTYIQNSSIRPAESYDLADALHYKRVLQAVNAEVDKLPERCRLVFKYSREENLPVKEIATQMNLSPSTVENHLNKALKRLHLVVKKMSAQIFGL